MPTLPFPEMPDRGRLWVFAADRTLEPVEERSLLQAVDGFLAGWKAHGHPLTNAREWREGRFLFIAVDPASEPPSGCSIDAMVHVLKRAEEALGVGLTDHAPVHYREDGDVRTIGRTEFKRKAAEGEVGPDTLVFDTTITSDGELREGRWERPARETWHGRAFMGEGRPRAQAGGSGG
ncbi:MAG: hypothetical protein KY453_01520 [Gemmatimonadetes bacterium]|nr:hypothetical protein [Gemmatimonadota bacterium]